MIFGWYFQNCNRPETMTFIRLIEIVKQMIDRGTCLFVSVLEEENADASNFNQGTVLVECRIQ